MVSARGMVCLLITKPCSILGLAAKGCSGMWLCPLPALPMWSLCHCCCTLLWHHQHWCTLLRHCWHALLQHCRCAPLWCCLCALLWHLPAHCGGTAESLSMNVKQNRALSYVMVFNSVTYKEGIMHRLHQRLPLVYFLPQRKWPLYSLPWGPLCFKGT